MDREVTDASGYAEIVTEQAPAAVWDAPVTGKNVTPVIQAEPEDGVAGVEVLLPEASGTRVRSNNNATIDYSDVSDGYVMAKYKGDGKSKVLITYEDGTRYQYDLNADGEYETYALTGGDGKYVIGVYRHVTGIKYRCLASVTVNVKLNSEFEPFLRPNQYVNYTGESQAVKKAFALCDGLAENLDKVDAVYDFVLDNVRYDYKKAATVPGGYLSDVDATLESGTGICLDYAALMAAMLRSQGVPVKLCVGYTGSVYHAWLNVYSETDGWVDGQIFFNGEDWQLMDPTFVAGHRNSAAIQRYVGNGENYQERFVY